MLMPRRVKYRKQHRGRRAGAAMTGNTVAFGEWGLQAQTTAWVDSRQIESARRAITGSLRRGGKVWIRIFPDKPVTGKPVEVRVEGRQRLYRLNGPALKPIFDWVREYERTWTERFDRLDVVLEGLRQRDEGAQSDG